MRKRMHELLHLLAEHQEYNDNMCNTIYTKADEVFKEYDKVIQDNIKLTQKVKALQKELNRENPL